LSACAAGCAGTRYQTTREHWDSGGDEVVAVTEDGEHYVVERSGARLVRSVIGTKNVEFQAIDATTPRNIGAVLASTGVVLIGFAVLVAVDPFDRSTSDDAGAPDDDGESSADWGALAPAALFGAGAALAVAGGAMFIGAEVVHAERRPYVSPNRSNGASVQWRINF
jgi:hypothetical protein